MDIKVNDAIVTVSLNRVKPAFIEPSSDSPPSPLPTRSSESSSSSVPPCGAQPNRRTKHSGTASPPAHPSRFSSPGVTHSDPGTPHSAPHSSSHSSPLSSNSSGQTFLGFSPPSSLGRANISDGSTVCIPSSCDSAPSRSSSRRGSPPQPATPTRRSADTPPPSSPKDSRSPSSLPFHGFTPTVSQPTARPDAPTVELTTFVHAEDIHKVSVVVEGPYACVCIACDDGQGGSAKMRVARRFRLSKSAQCGNVRAYIRPNGKVIIVVPADVDLRSAAGRPLRPPRRLDDYDTQLQCFQPRSPSSRPLPDDAEELSVVFLGSSSPAPRVNTYSILGGGGAMWRQSHR